jgi:hypothetical protein
LIIVNVLLPNVIFEPFVFHRTSIDSPSEIVAIACNEILIELALLVTDLVDSGIIIPF